MGGDMYEAETIWAETSNIYNEPMFVISIVPERHIHVT